MPTSFDHKPDCDVLRNNVDGIGNKPCNCGADVKLADRLLLVLSSEAIRKADLFDYYCWVEERQQRERVPNVKFLCCASDYTTCWGNTFAEAVAEAMKYDEELYEKEKNG